MALKNVDIARKASIYHQGQVTTRTVMTQEGEMKSMGIMLPGLYRFSTQAPETIEISQGDCRVKIEDGQDWIEYEAGDSFHIPAHAHYEVEVVELVDYIIHYE